MNTIANKNGKRGQQLFEYILLLLQCVDQSIQDSVFTIHHSTHKIHIFNINVFECDFHRIILSSTHTKDPSSISVNPFSDIWLRASHRQSRIEYKQLVEGH